MLLRSNEILKEKIDKGDPFIVARMSDNCTKLSVYKNTRYKESCSIYDGIYFKKKEDVRLYINEYNNSVKNSDFIASFNGLYKSEENKYFKRYPNIKKLYSRVLEPFYVCLEKEEPWSLHLYGKKVLIINPFVDSFQKQLANGFKIFKDKDIFHPGQEFVFYKSYQTLAGNHLHSSWLETFNLMKEDIRKLDFDFALLGCGGYGLPLCDFIKSELGKSAIYVGGGLQLLFGVKGKRWIDHPVIGKIIKENGKFISPSGDEVMKNKNRVEGGCYW
jgi:hypothetical protein